MTTVTSPAIAPGKYRIDLRNSRLAFTAKGIFGLETVRGTFMIRDGDITVAPDLRRSAVRATVDAGSFRTDKPRRDKHVTSQRFLDAPAYPVMTFTCTALEQLPDGRWQLAGELTVRDTTTDVTLTVVENTTTATGFRLTATGRVDRYAAGVTVARGFIGRFVEVVLDITATAWR
jgi:polyisoprenoid-binding protein YceI